MEAKFGDPRVPERIWRRLVIADDGCWLWTGSTVKGYGYLWLDRRHRYAHRALYHVLVRPVRDDEDVHHEECRNTRCANPAHMFPQDRRIHRGHGARDRTHCPKGHPLSGPNVYRRGDRPGRECRACRADRQREARNG